MRGASVVFACVLAAAAALVAAGRAAPDAAQSAWTLTYHLDWHSPTFWTGSGGMTFTFNAGRGSAVNAQAPYRYEGVSHDEASGEECTVLQVGTATLTGKVSKDWVITGTAAVRMTVTLGGACATYTYTQTTPLTGVGMPLEDGYQLTEALTPYETQTWSVSGHERWRMTLDVHEVLWGAPAPRLPRGHAAGVMIRSLLTVDFERSGGSYHNGRGRIDGFSRREAYSKPAGRYAVKVLPGNWPQRQFSVDVEKLATRTLRLDLPDQTLPVRWLLVRAKPYKALPPLRHARTTAPAEITVSAEEYRHEFVQAEPSIHRDVNALPGSVDRELDDAIWATSRWARHYAVTMERLQ